MVEFWVSLMQGLRLLQDSQVFIAICLLLLSMVALHYARKSRDDS